MENDKILENFKRLSRTRRACSYHKVDLHVHSPVSPDYCGDKDITPYEFLTEFVERGFDMIAITDHNTGTYIDRAVAAREQIAREDGRNITVLPGIELHVSPGIHLLAILPEGGSAAISDLLSRLQMPIEQQGDTDKLISSTIEEIRAAVRERGGLIIGAHCNSSKGILQVLEGQARQQWLTIVDALEINSSTKDDSVNKTISYVTKDLAVSLPFTFGSDSHDCKSDGTGMWVKMAEPSFTCLRQLTFEPDLRISRYEPSAAQYGRIVGFTTTHGIYIGERFRFSPNLNVLLGGRGAGKSAAIDLLRFAFELEPRSGGDVNDVFTDRIAGFLQSIGEVLVVIAGNDGERYVITRSGTYEKPSPRASLKFTETSRVYQVVGDSLIQRDMRPTEVLDVEFYGQGEVSQLANRVEEQLRLIDENLDHSRVTASILETEQKLCAGEQQLVRHRHRVEELQVEVSKRPELEHRREQLAESLADAIFAERSRWDTERSWVQGRQNWVQSALDTLPGSMPVHTDVSIVVEDSPGKAVIEKVQEASNRILESSRTELKQFRERIESGISELEEYRKEWDAEFEKADKRYRERLAELGAANLDQAAAELRGVEGELTRIETDVEPEMQRNESEISLVLAARGRLLNKLRRVRTIMKNSRSAFVDELNSNLGGIVVINLSNSDNSRYFDSVDLPLQGSGIQHREDQLSLACEAFSPTEFVEIVRANSIDKLSAIGITESNARRIVNNLTEDVLNKIERVDVPNLPNIRIKREGEGSYIDLSSLSVGEKCSAILSIALLSKGKPLVIDQPEDDLDHAFIIDSIVESIRNAKSDRQIIAATHNPNIPVLGDAEMVFRVARKVGEDACRIQNSGGLELPVVTEEVQSLEGGADAFERRRQRYSGVS